MTPDQHALLRELASITGGDAIFRPSSIDRTIGCPGSVVMAARLPKIVRASTNAQIEGSAAHKVAEEALNGIRQPDEWSDRMVRLNDIDGWFVDDEMVDAMSDAHDRIADAWRHAAEAALSCGQREVAQFSAERAECHASCADCLDDMQDGDDDDDDDEDDDVAPEAGMAVDYVEENFQREIGHVAHKKRSRPKRLGYGAPSTRAGARTPEQVDGNVAAAALAPLRPDQLQGVRDVYDRLIAPHIHDRW